MTKYRIFMREMFSKPLTIDGTTAPGHPWYLGNPLLIRAVETSATRIYARAAGKVAGLMVRKAYADDVNTNSQVWKRTLANLPQA